MSDCPSVTLWSCPNQSPSCGPHTAQAGVARGWIPGLQKESLGTASSQQRLSCLATSKKGHSVLCGSAHRGGIPPVPQKHYLAQTSVNFGPCSRGPKLRAVRKFSRVSNFTVPAAGDTSLPNTIPTSSWAPLLTRQKEHETDFRHS